ncbi:MAG: type II toxin-antitoxin system VapC family toxin [Chloroflexi bacterium]|nr:type II toxin-antitoxin system VapC family toxin [Chloroflexota bacterium]
MPEDEPGLLDTNIFLHAHTTDAHSQECQRFILALEIGRVRARLEPMVVHELSYALPRYLQQMTRADVAEYLEMILSWPGVEADKETLLDTIRRWGSTPGLAFVDAYLAALASRRRCSVYTMNLRELRSQGVDAPSPLPN